MTGFENLDMLTASHAARALQRKEETMNNVDLILECIVECLTQREIELLIKILNRMSTKT